MKTLLLCTTAIIFLASCKTINMESKARNIQGRGSDPVAAFSIPDEVFAPPPPEIIIVERPVFTPQASTPAPVVRGQQAVQQSNQEGIIRPSDFSHASMIYDYHPDWVYEVYAQPLRVSAVRLEPGERVIDSPFISDSERWLLGAGVSHENGNTIQHIYIKPSTHSLNASLIINTDRRVYHIVLKSFTNVYMPMVRFRYPPNGMPNNFIPFPQVSDTSEGESSPYAKLTNVDPRFLSFNYRVRHNRFSRPRWFPDLVFDDGRQTYIVLPTGVLQATFPAVFDNRNNIINYRVFQHVIIIDRLIEKATLRLDRHQVVIDKKRK